MESSIRSLPRNRWYPTSSDSTSKPAMTSSNPMKNSAKISTADLCWAYQLFLLPVLSMRGGATPNRQKRSPLTQAKSGPLRVDAFGADLQGWYCPVRPASKLVQTLHEARLPRGNPTCDSDCWHNIRLGGVSDSSHCTMPTVEHETTSVKKKSGSRFRTSRYPC